MPEPAGVLVLVVSAPLTGALLLLLEINPPPLLSPVAGAASLMVFCTSLSPCNFKSATSLTLVALLSVPWENVKIRLESAEASISSLSSLASVKGYSISCTIGVFLLFFWAFSITLLERDPRLESVPMVAATAEDLKGPPILVELLVTVFLLLVYRLLLLLSIDRLPLLFGALTL